MYHLLTLRHMSYVYLQIFLARQDNTSTIEAIFLYLSQLNRTVCGVIFIIRIGKDFGLKNSVVYTRTLLTENNKFVCIFSFTVFIVNEYFTTVTKLRICVHHLLLTIILSILKCVTLYQVIIIPSYLYSEMRELKMFNTSHFVTCTTIISNTHIRVNEIHLKTKQILHFFLIFFFLRFSFMYYFPLLLLYSFSFIIYIYI